jgi:HlyD family secretion protein
MMRRRNWILIGGAAVVVTAAAALLLRPRDETQYIASPLERGEIRDVVDATGTVNAVVTVQVGSQVSGIIAKLNADFNSRVHTGEVIAEIDPSLFRGALLQAQGDLQNAKANVTAAEADLAKARAALAQTKAEYHRMVTMVRDGLESQQTLELSQANYDSARASVDAAAAGVTQAKAQVQQKQAAVEVARINLDHTVIRSPIDGVVVARNVDVGQTVAASLQAPTIFTIAQDLTRMQVYANADEADVGRIKVAARVTFKVDAFPKDTFAGEVTQIRMNPTVVQNVVTYNAIIDFQNPDMKLFPGMTAYVTIPVATAEDALKVPNAALRYRPPLEPEAVQALYAKYGIDTGEGHGGTTATADSAHLGVAVASAAVKTGRETASATGGPRGAGGRRPKPRAAGVVVWKLHHDRTIEPVEILLGITDHAYTEVVAVTHGSLEAGDEVVTASLSSRGSGLGARGFHG